MVELSPHRGAHGRRDPHAGDANRSLNVVLEEARDLLNDWMAGSWQRMNWIVAENLMLLGRFDEHGACRPFE